jgi:mono/diheme cytochrome c family protein
VVVPLLLFAAFAGTAFALAKLHLAKPGVPKASGAVQLGDPYRGETVFQKNCAACHGAHAEGGIGPKLAGDTISIAAAKAQIENPRGTMPPNLVSGQDEKDVLAYLATIFAKSG